jgi:hypothetical protein
MNEAFRFLAAITMASTTGLGISVAQTPPAGDSGPRPLNIRPPVIGPAVAGVWSGKVLQVQQSIEYTIMLDVSARGAEISYPELHCGGKLSRIGTSHDYAFFATTFTRGPADDDGCCSNGTVTMARAGEDLVCGWFSLVKGEVITAYGTLTRKSEANAPVPAAEDGPSVSPIPGPATATPGSPPPPPVRKRRPPSKPAAPLTEITPDE